ncbi:alternative ribosome rescue aminoacyl-tRNA hydrolase ArfB [Hyunsoonleella sp. 2307UL5-6]|uniref:alternative ribosome rescue aminoacyl-tRNA hydrolase ArfB n=1 Tax=Hyunsoonleella sp. 2307UL5-6 TaxID=3384768 RepID=UPI0039BC3749
MMFDEDILLKELVFKAVRSSGSGGQHVNKVSSKIELYFDVNTSKVFDESQKSTIQTKLQHRLTKDGVLILQCGESRSQHKNKTIVVKRFLELIKAVFVEEKQRIPTKIPRAIIRKRLKNKKYNSEKKANRRRPDVD